MGEESVFYWHFSSRYNLSKTKISVSKATHAISGGAENQKRVAENCCLAAHSIYIIPLKYKYDSPNVLDLHLIAADQDMHLWEIWVTWEIQR